MSRSFAQRLLPLLIVLPTLILFPGSSNAENSSMTACNFLKSTQKPSGLQCLFGFNEKNMEFVKSFIETDLESSNSIENRCLVDVIKRSCLHGTANLVRCVQLSTNPSQCGELIE